MATTETPEPIDKLLDEVFRDPKIKHGLTFFRRGERNKIQLRRGAEQKIDVWCGKREVV